MSEHGLSRMLRCFPFAAALTIAGSALALEPSMRVFVEDPAKPIVHGATNLPDGADLIVTLSRSQSAYTAQSKVTVHNGMFVTEQFSQGDQPLNPGSYKLEVTMSAAVFQPESVQAVIGPEGEKMTGKLVKDGPLGPLFEYTIQVNIGGPANSQMDAAAIEKAKADLQRWTVNNCKSNIDFVNSLVRSGVVTGQEILGAERRKKIEDCIREAQSRPVP